MDPMLVATLSSVGVASVSALAAIWQANEARNARGGAEAAEKRANDIALSTVEALKEANRLTIDRVPELIQVAYERMLRALRPVSPSDWSDGKIVRRIQRWSFQMLRIVEMVGDDQPALGRWFEAERQRGLAAADEAHALIVALQERNPTESSPDAWLATTRPYNEWAAEMVNNLRMWRMGKVDHEVMVRQAEGIEKILRAKGRWNQGMQWRQKAESDP